MDISRHFVFNYAILTFQNLYTYMHVSKGCKCFLDHPYLVLFRRCFSKTVPILIMKIAPVQCFGWCTGDGVVALKQSAKGGCADVAMCHSIAV